MTTWLDISRDCRTASHELLRAGRWRSCVSRSYYGVYARVTHDLLATGVQMPHGRGNPDHPPVLATMIGNNLQGVLPKATERWELAGLVDALFKLRVGADYRPETEFDQPQARLAILLADKVYRLL